MMITAVLNRSGNVGKTTIARDVLARHSEHPIITIESINSDGEETTVLRGDSSEAIFVELLLSDNAVIDIGSSNIESFLESAAKEPELINKIDRFVFPVTPEKKQQADTVKTVIDITEAGVNPEQITIIFNKVGNREAIDETFKGLASAMTEIGVNIDYELSIYNHDIYKTNSQISELITNDDHLAKMQKAKDDNDMKKAKKHATLYARQKKALGLDELYRQICEKVMK